MTRLLKLPEVVPMLGLLVAVVASSPFWLAWLYYQWHRQRAEAIRSWRAR